MDEAFVFLFLLSSFFVFFARGWMDAPEWGSGVGGERGELLVVSSQPQSSGAAVGHHAR